MEHHGWLLLFHDCIVEQLHKLNNAAERSRRRDPKQFESNANVKLFRALSRLIVDTVPSDPARDEYRQGNTMGPPYRHWRRAKVGRRFRVFFRYDSRAKTIVFAWVNDEQTLVDKAPRSHSRSRPRILAGLAHRSERTGASGAVCARSGDARTSGQTQAILPDRAENN
jgi:toxin YhaV